MEGRLFQWTSGSHINEVEVLKEIKTPKDGVSTLYFESGRDAPESLIGGTLYEIEKTGNTTVDKPPLQQGNGILNEIAPSKVSSHPGSPDANSANDGKAANIPHPMQGHEAEVIGPGSSSAAAIGTPAPLTDEEMLGYSKTNRPSKYTKDTYVAPQDRLKEKDPLWELINNADRDDTELELKIKVKLPSKDFMRIILSSYKKKEEDVLKYFTEILKGGDFDEQLETFVASYIIGSPYVKPKKVEKPKEVEPPNEVKKEKLPDKSKEKGLGGGQS